MKEFTKTVVGLDVHKETLAVAVLPAGVEQAIDISVVPNTSEVVERIVRKVTRQRSAVFVYEAGPCGYEIQRQITGLGQECFVVAPGLIPVRATDRVKTDRRDAEKLARLWRAGELTAIWVPTPQEESARDLVRAREDVLEDRLRHRHRLLKFLLRHGRVFEEGHHWTNAHEAWIKRQVFDLPFLRNAFESYVRVWEDAEARLTTMDQQVQDMAQTAAYKTPVQYLRCFKGIDVLSAMTLLVEVQEFRRFADPTRLMKFTGLTPSEHSSGGRVRRGGISKTGNSHLRRILVEAAWSYRRSNTTGVALIRRREGCPEAIVQLARKAQDRLHRRFHRLLLRGKPATVVVTALARELAGFVWAMAQKFPQPA